MPYVFSTLPCAMTFTSYLPKKPSPADKPRIEQRLIDHKLTIAGGSGLVPVGESEVRIGARTEVTKEGLGFLLANAEFCKMVEDGFMAYHDEKKYSAEKMAKKGMETRDKSIQQSPKDLNVEEFGKVGEKIYIAKNDV